jgi:hypothetical protein
MADVTWIEDISETYGEVWVGEIRYLPEGKRIKAKKEDFKGVEVMMKSHSVWWPLSPYYLKNERGQILENIWQFRRAYEEIPASTQKYSKYDKTVIWSYPKEKHIIWPPGKERTVENAQLAEGYYRWRERGMNNEYAVRYPVGYKHRHKVLFSIDEEGNRLSYLEAREKIYLKLYLEMVVKEPKFWELLGMVKKGKNVLITEVDGPRSESAEYYQEKYGIDVRDGALKVTEENVKIFMKDPKHSFGHSFCLGLALIRELKKQSTNYEK